MKNLIICPVGTPITYDSRYDVNNHWRRTNGIKRNYETLVVSYNDFVPEENSYDHILHLKGHKWQIIREVPLHFDVGKYNYIGCVDDDLITDIQSFNLGLTYAENFSFHLWQLSMIEGSGIIYPCLMQNKEWTFTETNFVEMGSPFFELPYFYKAIDFFRELDFTIGWGIDKVFCDVLDCTANVVHAASIYHPPNTIKPSYYDQSAAMEEMNRMINEVYPKVMFEKYGKHNWVFHDIQKTLKAYKFT